MSTSNKISFIINPRRGLLLFLCISVLCYVIVSVISALMMAKGDLTAVKLRFATIIQDLLIFIVPAIAVAMLITRRPADFLLVSKSPGLLPSCLTVLLIISMVPAMNYIISWNESLQLPDSMKWLQEILQQLEDSANSMTSILMDGSSVGSIIMSVLIIGILTGFSEELYFRGALQRLLYASKININASIWITAFIFSAVHFQIFGFIPRLILGALFGYLMWWSRSVWLAMIAHMANNTMVVLATKLQAPDSIDLNTIGSHSTQTDKYAFWGSIIISAILIFSIYNYYRTKTNRINQTASEQS